MNVELPAQVQRQMDEVAEYDRQVEEAQAAPGADPSDPPQPAPAAEIVDAAPVAAPVEAPKTDEETYKARYLTLQGMFNQQIPLLNDQIKELRAQLAIANGKLEAALAPKPAETTAVTLDPKDVETYGADLMATIERVAESKVAKATATLEAERTKLTGEVAELKKQGITAAEQQTLDRRKQYFEALEKQVPGYEAINVEPDFIEWLKAVDPMFGLARNQGLRNAFDNFDVNRTALVFNAWLAAKGTPPTPAPAPTPVKSAEQQALERQTSPNRSKSTPPPADASADATRVWSGNEIDLFYRQVSQGNFRDNEPERARIEAAIDLAVAEHRIS